MGERQKAVRPIVRSRRSLNDSEWRPSAGRKFDLLVEAEGADAGFVANALVERAGRRTRTGAVAT